MEDTDEPFDWPVVTQTGEAWPPGTFVGAHGEDGVLVTVAGPDHDTVADVLATVQAVATAVDPNGCAVDRGRRAAAGSGRRDVGLPLRRAPASSSRASCSTGDDAADAVDGARRHRCDGRPRLPERADRVRRDGRRR